MKKMDKEIKKEVDDASKEALESKEIPLKELYGDIYLKNFEPKLRSVLSYDQSHLNVGKQFIPWK